MPTSIVYKHKEKGDSLEALYIDQRGQYTLEEIREFCPFVFPSIIEDYYELICPNQTYVVLMQTPCYLAKQTDSEYLLINKQSFENNYE